MEVTVCQTPYLSAEELAGKARTLKIEKVLPLPEEDAAPRKKGAKPSRDVLIKFEGKDRIMRCNVTNQWALALLLGSKKASAWEGKTVVLGTDLDADLENGGMVQSLRFLASPDATPEAAKGFKDAWDGGPRFRGGLSKRIKSKFRSALPAATME